MSESFEQLLNESFKTIRTGEVVKGTVIAVKENEIELAKSYLNYYAKQYGLTDTEYNVTAGYSFMADATSRAGKVIKSSGTSLIVVNIENEGWKIIPVSIKELTE